MMATQLHPHIFNSVQTERFLDQPFSLGCRQRWGVAIQKTTHAQGQFFS
jgi:hypothetical protein